MQRVWKRTLLAAGVLASSALMTPALAKHADQAARRHFVHSRDAHARHHARDTAGTRRTDKDRQFARAEQRRRAALRRLHRMASRGGAASGGTSSLVAEARRYLGGNPTGWAHDWCGKFMNLVLERTGHHGSGSNLALSFARYGRRVSGPQVGALAVMARRGGGHVGVVSGVLSNGDVKVISGNHGHKVAESIYRRGRILAFVMPTA
jgi:uncharacterized protein (TIGR02594 family)